MTRVVPAEASDLDMLADLIAEAFFDLPPSPWLISDPAARSQIFPAYFRLHLQHGLEHGQLYTTPDSAAAALWLPIGAEPPPPPEGYAEHLAAVTAPWTSQFMIFDAALEARHPAGTTHDHLALLAVRPGQQGRGIGTTLLQAHHQELDQARLPAYLEASTRRNRDLYLRHGYTDHGPAITLPGGPSLFPMWRQPTPHADPDDPQNPAARLA